MLHNHFSGFRPDPCYACTFYIQLTSSFMRTRTTAQTNYLNRSITFCHWYLGWNCSIRLDSLWLSLMKGRFLPATTLKQRSMCMCVGKHGGEMLSKKKVNFPGELILKFLYHALLLLLLYLQYTLCPYRQHTGCLTEPQLVRIQWTVPPCSLSHS